jgi:hypothetical protein
MLGETVEELKLLNNYNHIIKDEFQTRVLEGLKITDIAFPLNPFENFFLEILSILYVSFAIIDTNLLSNKKYFSLHKVAVMFFLTIQ